MTMLFARMSSTTPPLPRRDLNRNPRSVPTKTQLEIVTLRIDPDISDPKTTPPCPCIIVQLVTVTFSVGRCSFRPSSSVPHLSVTQSSPTSIRQSEMCTLRHDSGL